MKYLLIFVLLFLIGCSEPVKSPLNKILASEYELHFISSGDNFPEINLMENDLCQFLVGLHNGYSANEVQKELGWSETQFNRRVQLLKDNGFLTGKNQLLYPSVSIVTKKEGQLFYLYSKSVAEEIAKAVIEIKPKTDDKFHALSLSKKYSFREMSFFLLSDVLLDNWQINNVESDFLKKERTLRHGKRYYIQIGEKDKNNPLEVFGIYGNQYNCKGKLCFILYGNNRISNSKTFDELMKMDLPAVSKKDQEILGEMARQFRPKLIEILEKYRNYFWETYEKSVYKNEIPFEEYFIWQYHFIYTESTNILATKGALKLPSNGVFLLKLEN